VSDKFVESYVKLAQTYNLSTELLPPEALRQKADEYEGFLKIVNSKSLTEFLRGEIHFLRGLAEEMEPA
jgi:hypothetical protein